MTETVGAIMGREVARNPQTPGVVREIKPRFVRDAGTLPQHDAAPMVFRWPESDRSRPVPFVGQSGPLAPQTPGTNFLGAQLSDSGFIPPDSMGDIGPSQFLVCVNGRIRVFDRNGSVGTLDTTTDNFFSSVTGNGTSDPHVRYDRLSRRWFVVMIDIPHNQRNNQVLIAVSSGPTITSTSSFNFFAFKPSVIASGDSGLFTDYPTLGVDPSALYIGANMFNAPPFQTFNRTSGYVVRKSDLLSGTLTVTGFSGLAVAGGSGPFTPQGVDNDDPSATEGYFIGVDNATKGLLVMRRVSSPGTTPSISGNINVTVPATENPMGGVVAQGVSTPLDDLDDRLFQARIHHGSLWTAHNIEVNSSGVASAAGGRDGSRWYEITNFTVTPGLRQSGTVFDSSASNPVNYWIPTCAVSGQGHMALGCSVAGTNEHAEIVVAGRFVNDSLGTLQTPTVVQTSSTTYNVNDGTNPHRWGDFSAVSVDPNDDMTLWTVQEYCNADNSWGVRVIQLKAPSPATPTNCSPASIGAGTSNVNVVVNGMPTNGSGFFDPGAGYSNRISAVINGGGVTVNSITCTNPTHVTLNISVAGGAAGGTRTITITNPDGQSAVSSTGILTVTGGATNGPPSLSPISDKTINEGSALAFTNTATDPNGDALTFSLDPGAPSNATINPSTGVFSWTPTEAQGPGASNITVRVTDNGSPPLSDAKTFTVTVNEVNSAPVLTAITNRTVNEGSTLTFTNTATDSDLPANTLTFSLDPSAPTDATINPSTGVFSWTPTEAQGPGASNITVRVTDNGSPPLSDAQTFTVTVNEVNSAPVLTPITNRTVNEGSTLTFTNTATDSDLPANTLSFSLDPGAPTDATIDPSTGVFSWTPTEAQGPGASNITVRVTANGSPPLSDAKTFTVTVNEVNSAPVLTAITNRTVNEGSTLTFTNTATDSDLPANTLSFSLDPGAPTDATIDPSTGVFSWTPTEAQGPGASNITVRVTDNGSPPLSDAKTFTVTVNEVNSAPVLTPITNRTVNEGSTLTFTNTATDSDLPANTLSFSLDPGAPTDATIDPSTGVFSWTPTEAQGPGASNITVRVTANGSPPLSDAKTFTVTVNEVNQPPVLSPIPNHTNYEDTTLTFTNVASDPDIPANTLTFSLDPGAPTNAAIDSATGVFTWTPTGGQIGTSNFTVVVTDNGSPSLSATQSFSVTVIQSNNPPVLAAISNNTIAVGMTLAITNSASDPDSPPQALAFSLGAGVAANAAIDPASGVFTWTPTSGQIGTSNFTVVVTDDGLPPLSATQSFSVTVVPSNNPPVLTAIADRTIHAGSTLWFTNNASDPDSPPQLLTFSLGTNAPASAAIDSTSGVFNWRPGDADAGTTNNITVVVADNGLPPLKDAKSFAVAVVSRPMFESVALSNDVVTMIWSAIAGQTYQLQFNTDLSSTNWTNLGGPITAANGTATASDTIGSDLERFYRVLLVQ